MTMPDKPDTSPLLDNLPLQPMKKAFRIPKFITILFSIILILVLTASAIALVGYKYAQSFLPSATAAQISATAIMTSLQNRDLITAKIESVKLREGIADIDTRYQKINFLKSFPLIGPYVGDGQALINASKSANNSIDGLVSAIEPYSDLIGFRTNATASASVQSAEDKIVFLADTLSKISPQLESISGELSSAKTELDKINPSRYPEKLFGRAVRSKIILLKSTVDDTANILSQSQPLMKILPSLLGNPNPKLYMILFQNDAELRPSGGFMTAYAYIRVTKGKIEPLASYDIYELDAKWGKRLPAPDPIKKYLPLVNSWNLRDMNLSPDFKVSMDTFTKHIRDINGLPVVDGIIAIDTKLPVELLKVIGPIGVGGWGNFSANIIPQCNCPQVVYALEEIADRPTSSIRQDRKAVLGPLMHSMMANAMGSPKHLWPKLLDVGLNAIQQKHLMFYFNEESTQKASEDFNASGRIRDYAYDYLHINDANFGGAKTDMFLDREVEQEIESGDSRTTKTVTLTYSNPHKGSNCNLEAGQLCLNGTYRDWVRLYVPLGAKLISVVGSEVKEQTSEDLGKTVFEAFFTMRPESSSKLVFKYELPPLELKPYRLLIQKQPGKNSVKYTTLLNGKQTVVDVDSDTVLTLD